MRGIDGVRGYQREIRFRQDGAYATGGGIALTNCVVKGVDSDWQGGAPVLSLRFYHVPTPHGLTDKWAASGHQHYDEQTPVGVEINVGAAVAVSLLEQLQEKWPEFAMAVNAAEQGGEEPPENSAPTSS
ncbi:MAG: hypothetical protein IT168_31015 [Bryobacterales bacterium]|nr:hypothetical protein [Bryobacterales bacterium]